MQSLNSQGNSTFLKHGTLESEVMIEDFWCPDSLRYHDCQDILADFADVLSPRSSSTKFGGVEGKGPENTVQI